MVSEGNAIKCGQNGDRVVGRTSKSARGGRTLSWQIWKSALPEVVAAGSHHCGVVRCATRTCGSQSILCRRDSRPSSRRPTLRIGAQGWLRRALHHLPPKTAEMVKQTIHQSELMFRNPLSPNVLRQRRESGELGCFTTGKKWRWSGKWMLNPSKATGYGMNRPISSPLGGEGEPLQSTSNKHFTWCGCASGEHASSRRINGHRKVGDKLTR